MSNTHTSETGVLALPVAKLALLIPRLASNHDGEVVATARAIRRVLGAAGHDLHDLAAVLARVDSHRPAEDCRGDHDHRLDLLDELLASGLLSNWEIGFATSIRASILADRFFRPSPKQHAVLDRLLRKLGGNA
jgi:hypothetical protein